MAPTLEIIGVHKVPAEEPVHLIEILIRNLDGPFSLIDVTQEWPGEDQSNWQVAFDERVLNSDGTAVLFDPGRLEQNRPERWIGDVRFVFFFHFLNFELPLKTPFGDVVVPSATNRPPRLDFMVYHGH